MRKSIIIPQKQGSIEDQQWLDLGELAQVEITSEDPAHPIESALQLGGGKGWRAAGPGTQVIRLLFDQPQRISRIYLQVEEQELTRTQEFVLRSAQGRASSYRDIVRQQYNFSPGTTEREEYQVDLSGVTALELEINPDISGSGAKASLARLRVG